MNEKLIYALGCIDNTYVTEAARKKRKKKIFLSAVAAVLALAVLTNLPPIPFVITANAVAIAAGSEIPDRDDGFDAYWAAREKNMEAAGEASMQLRGFYREASAQFLSAEDENQIWSPANAAVALSALAETASGSTRQEVLDLLGVSDVESLRDYIGGMWESANKDDGHNVSTLANSLWLDGDMRYDQAVMDTLAGEYHASVYQTELGTGRANRAIQSWVNNNTGGLLQQMSKGIDVSAQAPAIDTALAMASTVHIQAKWSDEFSAARNIHDVFHGSVSDVDATYMNKKEEQMEYYWAEDFGAVAQYMKNGLKMWFFLPDEDKSVSDVLADEDYLTVIACGVETYENHKQMKVNLSVPKFDISDSLDLKAGLQELGLSEAFDENGGDFGTTFETDLPIFVSRVNQASRVTIDEQGVTAASYIELGWGAGAAAPVDEIIDFVLNRPFVFAIATTEGVPLFIGTINQL